jgi:uncharacterized protein
METVLITGGTGLIGTHLSRKLKEKGYNLALLSRKNIAVSNIPVYVWDPDKSMIDQSAILSADYIIHLAGIGIGDKKWTKRRRQLILDSRIKTGELIFNKVQETGKKPKAFVTASGIGYYGADTSEKIFSETDQPSADFTGQICQQWEQAADRFEQSGIRTVKIRTGIVLTKKGGALSKMAIPVKLLIGSALGSGRQYLPWIHIDDLCDIYLKAIEDSKMTGAFNAVAPQHVSNREFIRTLAGVMGKPFFFPAIPAFVMRLLFGKMSDILLNGSRVSSEKIISAGYTFRFPDLKNALRNLYLNA